MELKLVNLVECFKGDGKDMFRVVEKLHDTLYNELQSEIRAVFEAATNDFPEIFREIASTGILKFDSNCDSEWSKIVKLSILQQKTCELMIMLDDLKIEPELDQEPPF